MAAMTAPPKQTLHHTPALIALGGSLHLLPQHTRPFRKRHVVVLAVTSLFVLAMIVELAAVATRQSLDPRKLFSSAATGVPVKTQSTVRSSQGFMFSYDIQLFSVSARGQSDQQTILEDKLGDSQPISSIILTPLPSRVQGSEAAATLELRSDPDLAAFALFKSSSPPKTDIAAVLANYFAPRSGSMADVVEQGRTTESINGALLTKSMYQIKPKFAGNPTTTIVWTAEVQGKPFAVIAQGIVSGVTVPPSMAPIVRSLQLETETKALGLSITRDKTPPVLEQKYVADAVSPAVVKVYHIVCGSLVFKGAALSEDTCVAGAGSGFIVSQDGYIATNGHVVVNGAKDMLVNALLSDKVLLQQFLQSSQLTVGQVAEIMSRADLTASVVSRIYDIPDAELRLANQRELTVVGLGETPLQIKDAAAAKQIVRSFKTSSDLVQTTVVATDYASKDQLTVLADPVEGFSASDVALLKIDTTTAPVVRLHTKSVNQGQKITLFGFPTDADNQLTDNSVVGLTATSGSISSIRDAAGSNSKLYQSDADASHGNSGGPAVDDSGKAFGLLTYRYTSGDSADAAKSYIRDINDFTQLAQTKGIKVTGVSQTQDDWERGLDLYSKQHYSEALQQFKKVTREYPAHRLAATYIALSEQAVKDGRDVRDPSLALLIFGTITGIGALLLVVSFMVRHHGHHRVYRAYHNHGLAVTHSGH